MMDQQSTTILVLALGGLVMGYITKVVLSKLLGYLISFWLGVGTVLVGICYLLLYDHRAAAPKAASAVKFPNPYAFLSKENWGKELRELSKDKPLPLTMFPGSFVVSDALEVLVEYSVRDFVLSWYRKFSSDTLFPGQIDYTIRLAIQRLGDKVSKVDWADFLVLKLLPVITDHFEKFVEADHRIRASSSANLTESLELDHAVAEQYRKLNQDQKLHPAVVSKSYDYEQYRKKWLRSRVASTIVPTVLQEGSRIVEALVCDIVSCSIAFPVTNMLSDPDFWNQTVIKAGGSTLQDQQRVAKLRKALDEHSTLHSSSSKPVIRLSSTATNQDYDQFLRRIQRIPSVGEARQTRYYLSLQLKRTKRDGNNSLYEKRLKKAQEMLDNRIAKLSREIGENIAPRNTSQVDERENYTLDQILNDPACSLYFMEFMDQRRHTGLLQFWLTVNSLRDSFEFEGEDADPLGGLQTQSGNEEMNNKDDLLQIYQNYLAGEPVADIGQDNLQAIEEFGTSEPTIDKYKRARRAILHAQKIAFDKIAKRDLGKFKQSDLFLKFLASTPMTKTRSNNVDQLQMDGISESGQFKSPHDADLHDVEEAFMNIMNQNNLDKEPETDDQDLYLAGPGDLGLTEAISILSQDIERLYSQLSVLESLLSKAELTNNRTELRILDKSKASLDREIQRKELQRQQYMVQESENSLYGRTRIQIQSYMTAHDSVGEYVLYIIEVSKLSTFGNNSNTDVSAGWIVARRYSHFFELHQHLKSMIPQVSKLDFPKKRVVLRFQQKAFVEARRIALERYLKNLLEIPEVCRSKTFRLFLSSETFSVDSLNAPQTAASSPRHPGQDDEDAMTSSMSSLREENFNPEAESELVEASSRPFVQPICDAFIQIFGINRASNRDWLRGRAIVVVIQQLLGGTIEKKIRELIQNYTGSQRVTDLLQTLTNAMWPNGVLKPKSEVRTMAQRSKTRHDAQLLLSQLITDTSARVVGASNGRYAARNLFAMYQNEVLNAHLVYTMLDLVLEEIERV